MNMTVISMSCCNPAFRSQDHQYLEKIQQALAQSKVEAEVELMTGSEIVSRLGEARFSGLKSLMEKYGGAAAPALLIDGEVVFYGGVPTIEKLVEAISWRRP